MSRILAFDTSGPSLSVALLDGGRVIYECTQQNGLTHSDNLMPQIDAALSAANLAPSDVDCFAVVAGPGSFTGVRIGVTTAKALASATGKQVVGISALEAMAAGMPFGGPVCAMQDARAGQVYTAAFQGGRQVIADQAVKLAEFLPEIAGLGRCCFVGDGAVVHRETIAAALGENACFAPANLMMIRASTVGALALSRLDQAVAPEVLLPYYLRAPQAERERLAKEAAQYE